MTALSVVSEGSLHNECPVDLHPLVPVPVSTPEQIRQAVQRARDAQRIWYGLGFDERAKRLKQAGKAMLKRRQEVLELLHDETGKVPAEILMGEALGPLQYISDWIAVARPALKPKKLKLSPIAWPGKSGETELLPRGVVGVIAPWNFPLANFFKPVFAALICGNAVVLKPSEYSPRMGRWFQSVLSEFLGAGVIEVVQGDREAGQALIAAGIDALTFTGSSESGRAVAKLAAAQMIPVSLELGGKDAAVVLADCDLDRTVAGVVYWSLNNAGQACGDIERVIVEEPIADRFVERLEGVVQSLRASGDPQTSDVGPLANRAQLEVVKRHVNDAISKGATLVCGGKATGNGLWFEPTVLDRCTANMLVMQEPTFGPVIPIMRVASPVEAIAAANDCDYGLNASIWSQNIERATTLAREFEVGTTFVNNHGFTGAIASVPWTGVKQSGSGVANSSIALHHYTRPRTVVVDRNRAPDAWWYPFDGMMEQLGHRLSDAQLGKVLEALPVPLMISARQAAVLKFAREGTRPVASHLRDALKPFAKGVGKLMRNAVDQAVKLRPPLTDKEHRWARSAMDAIFPPEASAELKPLSAEEWKVFMNDLYENMPITASLGIRAATVVAGLLPVVLRRKLETLDTLSEAEQLRVVETMALSDQYLLRQMALLLKMSGGFAAVSTTKFTEATAKAARKAKLSGEKERSHHG